MERAENAAKASPKFGGVAGVFEGVPQGMPPPPPDLGFKSYLKPLHDSQDLQNHIMLYFNALKTCKE